MQQPPPPPPTPPGWHPDPQDSTSLRYWDGTRWTDQRAPRPAQTAASTQTADDPGQSWAVASLIFGLLSLVLFWLVIPPLLAFVFAMQSRMRSKGAGLKWSGMAIAGLVLGVLGLIGSAPIWLGIAVS